MSRLPVPPIAPMLRAATAHDAQAIAEVETAAAAHPWTAAQVASTLALSTTRAVVAEHEGRLVAHLLASSVAGEGEILTLATRPEWRRHGLARAMMAAVERAWAGDGVTVAWLEVRHDNDAALALYVAQGWAPQGLRPGYYADGAAARVLRRDLPPRPEPPG